VVNYNETKLKNWINEPTINNMIIQILESEDANLDFNKTSIKAKTKSNAKNVNSNEKIIMPDFSLLD